MWPRLGFAFERTTWKRWQVNGLGRVKQKERLVWFFFDMSFQKRLALRQKLHVDFFQIKIGSLLAWSIVVRVLVVGNRCFIKLMSRWHGDFFSVHVSVQPVGRRATSRSEKLIETTIDRPAVNLARIIDVVNRLRPALVNWLAFFVIKRQTNMPLAKTSRRVTFLSQHLRHR